jgi:type I restriction enzyme S subunit
MFYKETNFQKTSIGKIPRDWAAVEIGEVAEINKESRDPAQKPHASFLYIDIESIENGTGVISEPKEMLGRDAPSRARRVVHENDVIMSTVRPYLKAFTLIPRGLENEICSTGFAVFTCKPSIIPKYLLSCLFSNTVINQCSKMMVGAQYPALNESQVSKIKIPLAPIGEQQKIAEAFSSVDAALSETREIIAKTERLKQGLMQELLTKGIGHKEFEKTDIGRIPKVWEVVKIESIGKINTGKTPPTNNPLYWEGDIPFIAPGDIGDERYVRKATRYITKEGVKEANGLLPKESVIVVCIGSTIGKIAMIDRDSTTNQQINSIVCNKGITPRYVYYSLLYRAERLKSYSGVAAVPIIKKSLFEKFEIPLPPSIKEQEEIVKTLSAVDEKLETERAEKSRLERIKQGLMDVLLTGKIRLKM